MLVNEARLRKEAMWMDTLLHDDISQGIAESMTLFEELEGGSGGCGSRELRLVSIIQPIKHHERPQLTVLILWISSSSSTTSSSNSGLAIDASSLVSSIEGW